MAKMLSKTLVAVFQKMFDNRSATEAYLAQSKDLCELEMRMKRLHLTTVSYTHPPSPRDMRRSRMPSSA